MKLFLTTLLVAIMVALAIAREPHVELQSIIVSFPKGTPYSEMDDLKAGIAKVKGKITHEYNLFMGLAASVPHDFIADIKAMGADHDVNVETDSTLQIDPPA